MNRRIKAGPLKALVVASRISEKALMEPAPAIPFIDLEAQRGRTADRNDTPIGRVLAHGRFILGPEVDVFEAELAALCGVRHAVGPAVA